MGSVSSKGAVQITTVPASWISLAIRGSQLLNEISKLGNFKNHSRQEIVALFKSSGGVATDVLSVVALAYYVRNAFYSVSRSAQILPERRNADILSLLIAVAVFVLHRFAIRQSEQILIKQGDSKNFPVSERIWELSVKRVNSLKKLNFALIIILAFLQKRAVTYQ